MYAVDKAVAFAQFPYTYLESCNEAVRVVFDGGALYDRLRLEAFNNGAEVKWSVSWTGRGARWRCKYAYGPAAAALETMPARRRSIQNALL